ncbi:hypothetical protein O1611_g8151 [Lasiodiplodia mahajangana]|uniref:Uncharacterized protein n=1 Tax=Lasiodiplodia mahajangana TaxID=1108764 RepID=A0ACC2JDQ0_9PEZI|nr:hypothetical protein O1611_g8151 [Lasiodiplodia mahajangana]
MSEYVDNYNLDALMAPNEETFDFSFFNDPAPIGQNEAAAYDHNAGYGLNVDMGASMNPGFDFNAPMTLNEEIFDPSFLDNTALVGQNGPAIHYYDASNSFNFNADLQPNPSVLAPPDATAIIHQS